jgi:Flp pilus assembly pilin Flp
MLSTLIAWIRLHLPSERGQDLLEYALLGGLIAAAIIAVIALGTMTGAITDMATAIGDCIDFDSATACDPV